MTRTPGSAGKPELLMLHDYPPVSGGGLAHAVNDLSTELRDRFRTTVNSARLVDHYTDDRSQVPRRRRLAWLTSLWSDLGRADLVFVHWTFSFRWLSTVAVLLAPFLDKPVICVIHTAPDHCEHNRIRWLPRFARRLLFAVFAAALNRCSAVVALSCSHRESLLAVRFPVTHTAPLPLSAVPDLGRVHHRRLTRNPPTVGVAGELSTLKGTDRLLRVLPALTPEYRFHIVGSGPLENALCQQVHGLRPEQRCAIRIQPLVAKEHMPDFYRSVDVLLVPSRSESQARVVLEAMLSGVLVVSPSIVGVRDLVVHLRTGLCVERFDASRIRPTLEWIKAHPAEVHRIREQARDLASSIVARSAHRWTDIADTFTAPRGLPSDHAHPTRRPPNPRRRRRVHVFR